MCKPKVEGGLGIRDWGLGIGKISLRNHALLGKWIWRFPRESSTLQHQVILSIYGTHTHEWDVNTLVKWSHAHGRLFHRYFRILPSTFDLW